MNGNQFENLEETETAFQLRVHAVTTLSRSSGKQNRAHFYMACLICFWPSNSHYKLQHILLTHSVYSCFCSF